MFGCFGGVQDPISGRVAGSDGQTMANLEVRELKKRISMKWQWAVGRQWAVGHPIPADLPFCAPHFLERLTPHTSQITSHVSHVSPITKRRQ
eukprot:scaffold14019_cov57-Cyclotella_meneghiniana.AAC.3